MASVVASVIASVAAADGSNYAKNGTSLAQPKASITRKRLAISDDSSEENKIGPGTQDGPVSKRTRADEIQYDLKRAAAMCLDTELRRRRNCHLPALSDNEKETFMRDTLDLFEKVNSGITFKKIVESTKVLQRLTQNTQADKEHNHHIAALFTAQYTRIRLELNGLDAFMENRASLSSQELEILKGPIDRLYQHLGQDKIWGGIIPYLSLSTLALLTIGKLIRSSKNLKGMAYLAAKIDTIVRLLTPIIGSKDLPANLPDPLEAASKRQEELENKIARKDDEISAVYRRLQHELNAKVDKEAEHAEAEQRLKFEFEMKEKELVALKKQCNSKLRLKEEECIAARQRSKDLLAVQAEKFREDTKQAIETACNKLIEDGKRKTDAEEKVRIEKEEAKRTTQGIKRKELQVSGAENLDKLRLIVTQFCDGTLTDSIIAQLPEKNFCLSRLTELWNEKGEFIAQLLPHELIIDPDLALSFEVETMITALICLVTLQIRGITLPEFVATGWCPITMNRLKAGLVLYVDGKPLSSLRAIVGDLCIVLQDFTVPQQSASLVPVQEVMASSFNSSISSQQSSVFDQSLASSFESNSTFDKASVSNEQPFTTTPPVTEENSNPQPRVQPQPSINTLPAEDTNTNPQSNSKPLLERMTFPARNSITPAVANTPPTSSQVPHQGQQTQKPCRNMINKGVCGYGHDRKFSHGPAQIQQARRTAAGPSKVVNDAKNHRDTAPGAGRRSEIPCRNVTRRGWCNKYGCRFFHTTGTQIRDMGARPSPSPSSSSSSSSRSSHTSQLRPRPSKIPPSLPPRPPKPTLPTSKHTHTHSSPYLSSPSRPNPPSGVCLQDDNAQRRLFGGVFRGGREVRRW
ncbi:hypothetical protein GQ44DRAFT_828727 [Phaeosphaeriaceae sp. PMI808]|nr:hypothetical protein GQ44DRAFT_828727 [Phaeosphaeriaceae sp. PMI808]